MQQVYTSFLSRLDDQKRVAFEQRMAEVKKEQEEELNRKKSQGGLLGAIGGVLGGIAGTFVGNPMLGASIGSSLGAGLVGGQPDANMNSLTQQAFGMLPNFNQTPSSLSASLQNPSVQFGYSNPKYGWDQIDLFNQKRGGYNGL